MKRTLPVTLLAMLLLAALAPSAPAEDRTIDDLNIGTYWFGPKIDRADLAGKVVLVELWGG